MTSNLYIVGFMGAGKNAVGQRLAEMLNRKFVDMDDLLEEQFDMPIRDFFAHYGETAFRDAETSLLRRLSRRKRLVIATGGGVPEREENRRVMHDSGTIVHIDVRLETCMHRLTPEDQVARPKWQDKDSLERLYERRKAMYADSGLRMAGDGGQPAETARAILQELHPDRRFSAVLGDMSCQTICTWKAEEVLKEFVSERRPVILIDRTVARHHLERFSKSLESPLVVEIPPGELSKTLKRAQGIYETLLEHRFERGDLLIAIGGGVVTDLGAFVASTFKRGMNLVLVATSLLACVDAAIGGKAAVNLREAKNAVGCFATPMGVLLDIYSLRTLPRAGIAEGLVEAYKTGLVADPELAAFIEQEISALNAKDLPALAQAAMLSAKAKTAVVGSDFREQGPRRILNFGHTFGHAIEAWSRFRINHGRAVAMGMIVAMRLSVARGLLAEDTAGGILTTLKSIVRGKFVCPPLEKAWEIMRHDKKVQRGRIVFVLLEGAGRPVCVDDVSKKELESAIEAVDRRQ